MEGFTLEDLVYPRERTLGSITLVLGVLAWVGLIVGTMGGALGLILLAFLAYLFAQSALIAYIKGNGVALTPTQFPDLHARFEACCERLQISESEKPAAYVMHGGGMFNAFATRFLGNHFVVLLSEVVDAMDKHPDGVNFYIGHELGHIRMKHLTGHLWRMPVLWLPLLGAAYARAQESTCDLHGKACSSNGENAARALAALAAGAKRWATIDLPSYLSQNSETQGFWMSYHELTSTYPWLTKRVARMLRPEEPMPGRNPFAYLFAAFVPNTGRLGGGFGPFVLIGIVGIMAAAALPAYQDYTQGTRLAAAYSAALPARNTLEAYFMEHRKVPSSLSAANIDSTLPDGASLELDTRSMVLTVKTTAGDLLIVPKLVDEGIQWRCLPAQPMRALRLPLACRNPMPE